MSFTFTFRGDPHPQKQTQFTKNGFTYNPSKKDEDWIKFQVLKEWPYPPLTKPVKVNMEFWLKIPKSMRKKDQSLIADGDESVPNFPFHAKRPDLDNLEYLVCNALKGIVYKDDSQICDMYLKKRYSFDPRTVVTIEEI